MLLLSIAENEKHDIPVASGGLKFIPCLLKIDQLVQTAKHAQTTVIS
jgi:hypothetical protein